MKFTPTRLAVCALLAAAGFAAQAQPAAPAPAGAPPHAMHDGAGMHERMHERMQEHRQQRFQRRMDGLKRVLQLNPSQDGAWNAWVAAMTPPAQLQRPAREAFAHMSTPQRIDQMRQARAQRAAEMDRRGAATKTFYAPLTPPQQKAFDEISLKFLARGRHGDRHHGM